MCFDGWTVLLGNRMVQLPHPVRVDSHDWSANSFIVFLSLGSKFPLFEQAREKVFIESADNSDNKQQDVLILRGKV